LLIGSNASFFSQSRNYVHQLSPCNAVNSHSSSSSLYSNRLSVFRPKVDEISLLVVNYTELNPVRILRSLFLLSSCSSSAAPLRNRVWIWRVAQQSQSAICVMFLVPPPFVLQLLFVSESSLLVCKAHLVADPGSYSSRL
jgi:hypothetical protein